MYKLIKAEKFSDLTEEQWKKYYNLRLLFDESVNSRTPFANFEKFKNNLQDDTFDGTTKLFIISDSEKYTAHFILSHRERSYCEKEHLNLTYEGLSYDVPKEIINMIKNTLLENRYENELVLYEAPNHNYSEMLKALSGKLVLDAVELRLDIKNAYSENIDKWYNEGLKNNPGITLKFFTNIPNPELTSGEVDEYFNMFYKVNLDIPNYEEFHILEGFKELTLSDWKDDYKKWNGFNLILILFESRKMIGLSNVFIVKGESYVTQSITGVLKEYRYRGLGKLLKAAMFKKLVEDYSENLLGIYTVVDKRNFSSLKNNKLMGFKYNKYSVYYKLDI